MNGVNKAAYDCILLSRLNGINLEAQTKLLN